jgi:hypothetical protein
VNDPPGRTITDGYTLSYDYANGVKLSFTQVAFHPGTLPAGGQQTFCVAPKAPSISKPLLSIRAPGHRNLCCLQKTKENRERNHIEKFYDASAQDPSPKPTYGSGPSLR